MLTVRSGPTCVALALTDWALDQADTYRALCNRLEEGWQTLAETEQARRRAEMDAMLDDLLPRFWLADEHQLMSRVE
ncbi:MAG: hypothetical protein JRF07_02920 [Deltaproteobacteria bacterium]|jgi:ABC-type nitrate/sulfonate/bicarbonate transport system substrate-binding protein|nr:hypothetical protein [Deltaproteobacteria bacterium]